MRYLLTLVIFVVASSLMSVENTEKDLRAKIDWLVSVFEKDDSKEIKQGLLDIMPSDLVNKNKEDMDQFVKAFIEENKKDKLVKGLKATKSALLKFTKEDNTWAFYFSKEQSKELTKPKMVFVYDEKEKKFTIKD